MKKKIIIGSVLSVFILVTMPFIATAQMKSAVDDIHKPVLLSPTDITLEEFIEFLTVVAAETPQIQPYLAQVIEHLHNNPKLFDDIKKEMENPGQSSQQTPEHQDGIIQNILQRMWLRLYRHHLTSFIRGVVLYIRVPSKITLMIMVSRTMKLLRCLVIGDRLGFIDLNPVPPPTTPTITCTQDDVQNTLTVASIDPTDVLWGDIEITGSCNVFGLGTYITVGDQITECSGTITMTFLPTDTIIGTWTFS